MFTVDEMYQNLAANLSNVVPDVELRYKALGGEIVVIAKPGCDHHPHSLKDPAPIVDFILKHTSNQN